MRIVEKQHY